jgi:hypothetical protein
MIFYGFLMINPDIFANKNGFSYRLGIFYNHFFTYKGRQNLMDTDTILKPTGTAQECVATHSIPCLNCKTQFPVKRKWQRFCSDKCRFIYWDKQHPRTKGE